MAAISKEMRWNDYRKEYGYDLYLRNGDEIIVISEGTGDNISDFDEELGYVDYWMVESLNTVTGEYIAYNGQWMETEYICDIDYTIAGVIERIKECDAPEDLDNWEIMDPHDGRRHF